VEYLLAVKIKDFKKYPSLSDMKYSRTSEIVEQKLNIPPSLLPLKDVKAS